MNSLYNKSQSNQLSEDFLSYYCPFEKWKSAYNSNDEKRNNNVEDGRIIRYSTTNPLDENFRRTKPYLMYRHKFHPQGFHLFGPSKAGLEPLTAIRIMQSRLKDLAIKSRLTEREIKAEICNSAIILFEKAEKDIEQLDKKRNDALIFGEEKLAKELSKQIRDKFDRALFGTYADLLLDAEEVKAFGIESKWIGQSQGKLMNETGRRKSDSQNDWENLDAARKEERRRRRERRRGRRAKSAVLGTMMRERYDISDLEGPAVDDWHKRKRGKEKEKTEKNLNNDGKDEEEDENSSSDVNTEEEDNPKTVQTKTDEGNSIGEKAINKGKEGDENGKKEVTQNSATLPLEMHSDTSIIPIPAGEYRRSLSASNPPNRKGILKDANGSGIAAFDSDSRLSSRRRPSFMRMKALNEITKQQRRQSSTMPPSMAKERGKANLIEDAIQRLQRRQRRVGAIQGPTAAADGVKHELEALDGVSEAAKRFAHKRKEKTKEIEEEAKKEEANKSDNQKIEGEEEPKKRVNFQIENGKSNNLGEILLIPLTMGGSEAKMQWKRNSRTNLHKSAPEWRPPNQQMPTVMVDYGGDEDEAMERLFPELVKTSAKLVDDGKGRRSITVISVPGPFFDMAHNLTNICPYCEQRDPWLENDDFLRFHLADCCPFLTRCEFCDKIVEVHDLNDHHLKRCPFLGDTLIDCYLCGMARYPDEPGAHPKCKFAPPPRGGAWCPLCSDLIRDADSKQNWLEHLTEKCFNNPRTRRWQKHLEADQQDRPTQMLEQLNETLASVSTAMPFRTRVYHNYHQPGGWRQQQSGAILDGQFGLPSIGSNSSSSAAGIPQIRALDVHHLRAAIRRLNHERRVKAIQRNVRISRRGPAEDSDSD